MQAAHESTKPSEGGAAESSYAFLKQLLLLAVLGHAAERLLWSLRGTCAGKATVICLRRDAFVNWESNVGNKE